MRIGVWPRFDVAYHEGRLDDLVLDALAPVVHDLRARGTDCYLQRHWQRGPHVRLVVSDDTGVRDLVTRHVEPFLRAHPSTTVLDEAALLPQHRRQAAAEQVTGPLSPFLPDNTVVETLEEDRAEVLGSARAQRFFREFYVRSTPLVLDALEDVRSGRESRLEVFLSLMLTTAHECVPGGVDEGFWSFRSHAEAFLATADPSGDVRRRWSEIAAERSGALEQEVRRATEGRERVVGWRALLAWADHEARRLVDDGALAFRSLRDTDGEGPRRARQRESGSEFHRRLAQDDAWFESVESSPGFRTYRVCLNLAYHLMTQLGGTAMERYLLCHLAADAVQARSDAAGTTTTKESSR